MRKISIEVVLLEPLQPLDQNQKDDSLVNTGEVEGHGEGRIYIKCPYCNCIMMIDKSVLESGGTFSCPNCGATSTW
jgi:hypothetical protein